MRVWSWIYFFHDWVVFSWSTFTECWSKSCDLHLCLQVLSTTTADNQGHAAETMHQSIGIQVDSADADAICLRCACVRHATHAEKCVQTEASHADKCAQAEAPSQPSEVEPVRSSSPILPGPSCAWRPSFLSSVSDTESVCADIDTTASLNFSEQLSGNDSIDGDHIENTTNDNVSERKFIVFESALYKLLCRCLECGGPVLESQKSTVGSMSSVTSECSEGHSCTWQSPPTINQWRPPGKNWYLCKVKNRTLGFYLFTLQYYEQ